MAVNVYTTAVRLGRPRPTWVTDILDADRVQAYQTYWDLYRNLAEALAVVMRDDSGEEISRRYIPSARTIIEATNSYLGRNLTWTAETDKGQTADQLTVMGALDSLFAREKFRAKFSSLKRWMLVRGDAMFHITADPLKAEGTRISITEISPETYFPIPHPIDTERVIGCYIVQPMEVDDENIVSRLLYRRILTDEDVATYGKPLGSIVMQLTFWEPDGWDDRDTDEDLKPVEVPPMYNNEAMAPLLEGTILPAPISQIPVYHFRNNYAASEPFGVSELQGIETLIAGVSQTYTDEEIALVLQGIGVYYTDSGAPQDDNGDEVDWVIAPAAVLELQPGTTFGRVQGVSSVQPFQDHKNSLKDEMWESTGTPGVAIGKIEVAAAQSGIALEIKFRPLLAKNAEKEEELRGVLNQMLWDLVNGFLPAYEGISPGAPDNPVVIKAHFDDPLPLNRKDVLAEIIEMVTAKIIDTETARIMLAEKLGMKFPAGVLAAVVAEQQSLLDPMGGRIDEEAAGSEDVISA